MDVMDRHRRLSIPSLEGGTACKPCAESAWLDERAALPPFSRLARLEDQFQHRPSFLHAVYRALAFAQTIREVPDLRLERIHVRKRALGRLAEPPGQVIQRVVRPEELPLLAHAVNWMRPVRQRERPAREDLPDRAVLKSHLHRRRILSFDRLHEAPQGSLDLRGRTPRQMQQPIRWMISRVDQLTAALRLQ